MVNVCSGQIKWWLRHNGVRRGIRALSSLLQVRKRRLLGDIVKRRHDRSFCCIYLQWWLTWVREHTARITELSAAAVEHWQRAYSAAAVFQWRRLAAKHAPRRR